MRHADKFNISMNNLIRAAAFQGFNELVRELAGDPEQILAKVSLSTALLSNTEQLVSSAAFIRALNIAAQDTHCPDFGLRLGERQNLKVLGAVGILARQAKTISEAFAIVSRYFNLHNTDASLGIETYNNKTLLVYDNTTPGHSRDSQVCDLALAASNSTLQQFGGNNWSAKGVFFIHKAPNDLSQYQRIFNAPLYFDQPQYAIEFENATLDIEHLEQDPEINAFFSDYVSKLAATYASNHTEIVGQLIRSLLSTGYCTEERIASILQVNRRTIQRRLKSEGSSFKQLLADIRLEMAKHFLRDTNLAMSDISIELGYSETSAFMRFFKQHAGITALSFRQGNS
ncbi:AraC family transcriptional regulator [Maricurvus nonylphenolicus]|uniref:AraC family transcriptional regulator n=1 Tax=Maricurvus nonylphenolicus TaxID=1008307 RepID=UPI0036F32E53